MNANVDIEERKPIWIVLSEFYLNPQNHLILKQFKMIDKFLKAKHWQLFTLMFGIPIIAQILIMGTMFLNISTETNPDPTEIFNLLKFFPIIMILYMGVFFGWFWSVAMGLQNKIPENIRMKTKKFKLFFFIPLIYLLCFSLFFGGIFNENLLTGTQPGGWFVGGMFGIIFPLHILSMFCIFYAMYFVAKTIKTVELQKEVNFGEFAGEFFMIWFYFVGIWILQPKINKMVEVKNIKTSND